MHLFLCHEFRKKKGVITMPQDTGDRSEIIISPAVLMKLAAAAAYAVDGVARLHGCTRAQALAGKSGALRRAVRVTMSGGVMQVEVRLTLAAGVQVNGVCAQVQRRVIGDVLNFAGKIVSAVKVVVEDIEG